MRSFSGRVLILIAGGSSLEFFVFSYEDVGWTFFLEAWEVQLVHYSTRILTTQHNTARDVRRRARLVVGGRQDQSL